MEFLLRRLQAITDGQGNHNKYQPEELNTQRALFWAKSINKRRVYPK
jgi:hypothetical protein